MATKFLDYTGLSHLWSKFKEWCNSIFVTKATDENITGTKTFVGSKKIAFKQSGANDKLGFTLFNNSGKEQGYLEYNPTNKLAGVPLMTLGNYATADNELTYVGFRRYSNISGASGAYNLLTPLISDAKSHFNLTTTYTNFYLPLGISDGTNIVTASNSGIFDISSLLSSISTIEWSDVISKPTTISGYGITDAKIDNGTITLGSSTITPLTFHQTLPTLSSTVSGSGNAITDITVSDHAITATKGATFLTSHQTLPTLSKINSGSGNAVTGISVSNHAITVTKGSTFALDSNVVHTSGDETVTGYKVFEGSGACHIGVRVSNMQRNSTIGNYWNGFYFLDRNSETIQGIEGYVSNVQNSMVNILVKQWNSNIQDYKGVSVNWQANGDVFFRPVDSGVLYLGGTQYRWKTVYASNGTINTSDERLKSDISSIPDEVLDAWEIIDFSQFRFNSAIDKEGENNARFHTGVIAQRIKKAFSDAGLDVTKYGFFCYDQWEAQPEQVREDGTVAQKAVEAGDLYSIRYEEALCIEAAYQRRKNKILENRISELEKQVSDMLILLRNLTKGNG